MAKKIKILKPGTFVAMNKNSYSFTEDDLRATAAAYDPILYAAPLVKGHPKHDAPAFGRLYALEFADGYLYGYPGKVDSGFAEEVNSGHYDNVSLSVYAPNHPSNPCPGVYYPKHLGFLGAMSPAVKGLGLVSLSEGEEEVITIEFAEPTKESTQTKKGATKMDVKKRAQFCADCEDQVCTTCCPTGAISMNADKGAIIDPAKCTVCMKCCEACCMMQGPVYGMQVANYAEQASNNKKAENIAFAEGLVKEGKLLPANKATVIGILDFCCGLTSGQIELGEGDSKTSESPADALKSLLQSSPKVIEFGELVHPEDNLGKKDEPIPGDIAKYI